MPNPTLVFYDPELGNACGPNCAFDGDLPCGWTVDFSWDATLHMDHDYCLVVLDDREQDVRVLRLNPLEPVPIIKHRGSENHEHHMASAALGPCTNKVVLTSFSHGSGQVFEAIVDILRNRRATAVKDFVAQWRHRYIREIAAKLAANCTSQAFQPTQEMAARIQTAVGTLPADFQHAFEVSLGCDRDSPNWLAGACALRSLSE